MSKYVAAEIIAGLNLDGTTAYTYGLIDPSTGKNLGLFSKDKLPENVIISRDTEGEAHVWFLLGLYSENSEMKKFYHEQYRKAKLKYGF